MLTSAGTQLETLLIFALYLQVLIPHLFHHFAAGIRVPLQFLKSVLRPATTSSMANRPRKRLVVFCDGTWVGRETTVADAPASNIRQLANMVGEVQYSKEETQRPATVHPIKPHGTRASNPSRDIVAGYQEGCGMNATFIQYIWNGATASDIGEEIVSVYKFIVDNFTDDHEIWLFGFSRGAFTVRCIAGMINNCGIIRRLKKYTEKEVQTLCLEIFRTYRSKSPHDAPQSEECKRWRGLDDRVWQVARPIRFMGIIDTVGALGIPRVNAGVGFDWEPLEFFDQKISSVVQHVYHAPALHERLWMFQPCLVYPSDATKKDRAIIHQRWFPGAHYDVGRMTFRFIRQSPVNSLEQLLGWLPDLLSRTIYPNQVLGDCVLRWLIQGIGELEDDAQVSIIPDLDSQLYRLSKSIALADPAKAGTGDIAGRYLDYIPGGMIWGNIQHASRAVFSLLNRISPRFGDNIQDLLGMKFIIGVLTATTDRKIPGTEADIFPYKERERISIQGEEKIFSVAELADMDRYISRTFESFQLWKEVYEKPRC